MSLSHKVLLRYVIYFNLSIYTNSNTIFSVIQWLGTFIWDILGSLTPNSTLGLKMYRYLTTSSLPLITTLQIDLFTDTTAILN